MKSRCRILTEIHDASAGWGRFRTLNLNDAQQSLLAGWLSDDLDQALPAQTRSQDVALMGGADLWALPDDELKAVLKGQWRITAHTALMGFVPNIDLALEARFGEQFSINLGVEILTHRGYDGSAFAQLPIRGYHWWGTPYVKMLRKSPRLSAVSAHIGKSRAGEIARINGGGGWTVRGRAAKWLVEGVSWIVGGFVGETDWKGILHAPR